MAYPPKLVFKILQIVQNTGGGFKNRDAGFKGRGFGREVVFRAFMAQAGGGNSFDEGPPCYSRCVSLQIGVLKDAVTVIDHAVDLPILTDPDQRTIGFEKSLGNNDKAWATSSKRLDSGPPTGPRRWT